MANKHREEVGLHRIKQSLGRKGLTLDISVNLASQITSIASISDPESPYHSGQEFDFENLELSVDTIDRARKVTEVVEDEYGIDLGHGKFATIANFGKDISSLAGVAIAVENLITASSALLNQYNAPERSVTEETHLEFALALALLILECALFKLPISFRAAWRGTRFLNNRLLWRLRGVSNMLYRIVLSEVHRLIRDIAPKALTTFTKEFVNFVVPIVVRDYQINWDLDNYSKDRLLKPIGDTILEFLAFAKDYYGVETPEIGSRRMLRLYIEFFDEIIELSLSIPVPPIGEIKEFLEKEYSQFNY